jgi:hypothetical protein
MGLHVVSISHVWLAFASFLVTTIWAVRPETPQSSLEQVSLNLVHSGHTQKINTSNVDPEQETAKREQPMQNATVLVELARTTTAHSGQLASLRLKRSCGQIAKLTRKLATSSTALVQVFSPPRQQAPSAEDALVNAPGIAAKEDASVQAAQVSIQGVEYVPQVACESATDVLTTLISEQRHAELAFMFGSVLATLVAVVFISIFIGANLKPAPPSYWKNKVFCCAWYDSFDEEVDVTNQLLDTIQKLVDNTTLPEKMGVPGLDGDWQTHKGFRVKKVIRIENGRQWNQFATARKAIPTFFERLKEMPEKLRTQTEDRWRNIHRVFESRESDPDIGKFLNSLNLDSSRNEVMLFHGTPMAGSRNRKGQIVFETEAQSPCQAVKKTGFDERLGSVKGRLGAGTYFGDQASKGDEYAGRYHEWKDGADPGSVGEEAAMFLARVVLGCPYITTQSLEALRRPPCIQGHFDFSLDSQQVEWGRAWREKNLQLEVCDHGRCDSVISDFAIDVDENFREYVLYEKRCYPEFLIKYERIA